MNYRLVFFIALFNGLILIVGLLYRKRNRLPNLLLAGIVAAALFSQWIAVLKFTGDIENHPLLLRSRFPANLLIPSLFYLYILSLTVPEFKWRERFWLHFVPFLLGCLAYLGFLLFSRKVEHWREDPAFLLERYILAMVSVGLAAAYFIPCLRQFQRFKRLLPHYFSNLRTVRLLWLRVLLVLFLIPWIVGLAGILVGPYVLVEQFTVPAITVSILGMGFFGFQQSAIFSREEF